MESSTGKKVKGRKIGISLLTGIGFAIAGFIAGTIASGLLIFLFFSVFGTFSEVGPLIMIFFSPIVGVVTAVIVGIRGGKRTYKRISE